MKALKPVDVRRAAMDLLARREHSQQELQDKLVEKLSRKFLGRNEHSQYAPPANARQVTSYSHNTQYNTSRPVNAHSNKVQHNNLDLEETCSDEGAAITSGDLGLLIQQQIQLLSEENLQSDERFVESFINGRKAKGKGPRMIRQELTGRGVEDEIIDSYLQDNSSVWFDLADKAFKKKFGEQPAVDLKERAKRQRFMLHRGFLFEHFSHLLEHNAVV